MVACLLYRAALMEAHWEGRKNFTYPNNDVFICMAGVTNSESQSTGWRFTPSFLHSTHYLRIVHQSNDEGRFCLFSINQSVCPVSCRQALYLPCSQDSFYFIQAIFAGKVFGHVSWYRLDIYYAYGSHQTFCDMFTIRPLFDLLRKKNLLRNNNITFHEIHLVC